MLIAITGTPGVGKTTVSEYLRKNGYAVIDGNEHIKKHNLLFDKDEKRDTYNIDVDSLNETLDEYRKSKDLVFFDSHLSHMCDCSRIIVLRCHPDVLADRLSKRGYSENKIRENVQAEILDVILSEAVDTDIPVNEIDCTASDAEDVGKLILNTINTEDTCKPGTVDWSGSMEKWFQTSTAKKQTF